MPLPVSTGPLPAKGDVRPLVVGTNVGAYLSVDNGATWTQAAGLPAVEANYTLAGTCFRKFAVVSGQHEYLLNFGHDGSLSDDLIDVIVDSFQFVDR